MPSRDVAQKDVPHHMSGESENPDQDLDQDLNRDLGRDAEENGGE